MRQTILGCEIDNLNAGETLDRIGELIGAGGAHQHVVLNVDKIVKASRDDRLKRIIADCDLISADGMPVIWASRLLGQPLKERVTGVDLFFALLGRAEQQGWPVYFLGGREAVVGEVVKRARASHPGLLIAGHRNGYWTADEEQSVVDAVGAARPRILFVALNSPRKEEFLARYQREMQVPFAMGVGGTFDVMAGVVSRAPRWMQSAGLEWFFRFLQEPRRMFRRYFIEGPGFFVLVAEAMVARRRELRPARGA